MDKPDADHPTPAEGLTGTEALRRLREYGPNAVEEKPPSPLRAFLGKFWAPIPWLLEAAILMQLVLGEPVEAAVVFGLLLFNATLGLLQEGRATAALAALKQRLAPTALVRRDGAWTKLPAAQLVPGDVIRLALGAIVPADARILAGSVMVDQSMVTGESVPIEAEPGALLYASGLVRRGQAVAQVTATGAKTFFGRAAELVRIAHGSSTEQRATFAATRIVAAVNGAIAVLIVTAGVAMRLPLDEVAGLALSALLASIPVALPATFSLSAAIGAQALVRRGVLLTRLSAAQEAAAMDVLCSDKTGTLTRNALALDEIAAMPGFDRARVLALAALASSEADQDPIDAAIQRAAAQAPSAGAADRRLRFIPFDPATRTSEAVVIDAKGDELRIVKGAFHALVKIAATPADARGILDDLAIHGHRVIAVAAGPAGALRLAGLIALSDPPREDSAALIAALKDLGVRTVMVTGDSPVTAAAIAEKVGISGKVSSEEGLSDPECGEKFGVFARVVPEQKYRLVRALQHAGHIVGMCGDGANDAPALRQAQIGIAVSSATDVAKAAAALVLTEPGLAGVVFAIREGRIGFQRVLAYTFNMLVKKFEVVLFLGCGLVMTGHVVITPVLMVLLIMTNDFLSMSLTTDRMSPAPRPSRWRMRNITATSLILGVCKLIFSTAILAAALFAFGAGAKQLQTTAFVILVFGNQLVTYALREHGRLWRSRPSLWVLASSALAIAMVLMLAATGTLMAPLPWPALAVLLGATACFMFLFDEIKLRVAARFPLE